MAPTPAVTPTLAAQASPPLTTTKSPPAIPEVTRVLDAGNTCLVDSLEEAQEEIDIFDRKTKQWEMYMADTSHKLDLFDKKTRQWAKDMASQPADIRDENLKWFASIHSQMAESIEQARSSLPAGKGSWRLLPYRFNDISPNYADNIMEFQIAWVFNDGDYICRDKDYFYGIGYHGGIFGPSFSPYDFNNDGFFELIVEIVDDEAGPDYEILTLKDGQIVTYPPAKNIHISSIYDFDKDGRLDIVSRDNYWSVFECDSNPEFGDQTYGAPNVLFHGLPDGTFSPSDDVAATYLKKQCPPVAHRPFLGTGYVAIFENIACARAWGMSAKDAKAQMKREWEQRFSWLGTPSSEEFWMCDYTLDSFLDWAEIEPPLVLK